MRALPVLVLGFVAVRGVAQETVAAPVGDEARTNAPAAVHGQWTQRFSNSEDWVPPAELAQEVREAVARRWGVGPDSVHIEWREPPHPIAPGSTLDRLLGPGRAGSWIATLAGGPMRQSLRFRAGTPVFGGVAGLDLPKGHTLRAADIEWAETIVWGTPPTVVTPVEAGWITQRSIGAGEPLAAPRVAPAPVVESGDVVTARWAGGRIQIEVPAEVVGSGAVGDAVTVRLATGLRVEALIVDARTVVFPISQATEAAVEAAGKSDNR